MAFPPTPAPTPAPAQGATTAANTAPAQEQNIQHNPAHSSGGSPGFAANGHHTPEKQAEHQANLNRDAPPTRDGNGQDQDADD